MIICGVRVGNHYILSAEASQEMNQESRLQMGDDGFPQLAKEFGILLGSGELQGQGRGSQCRLLEV